MKFAESHEWIKVENGIGVVGISDHAQHELGDIVYVELPVVGRKVKQGEEAAVLESTKAAADVYSPMSGEIIAVNDALKTTPEEINESPESRGWLFKLKIENEKELGALLDARAYQSMLHGRK